MYNIHKIAYAITIIWYTGYNKYLIQLYYHLRFHIYINIPQYTPGFAKSVCLMMLCFADFFKIGDYFSCLRFPNYSLG